MNFFSFFFVSKVIAKESSKLEILIGMKLYG